MTACTVDQLQQHIGSRFAGKQPKNETFRHRRFEIFLNLPNEGRSHTLNGDTDEEASNSTFWLRIYLPRKGYGYRRSGSTRSAGKRHLVR